MDTVGNVNHEVNIDGSWVYNSNYKRALNLMIESLYFICYTSKYDNGMHSEFEMVYYTVRYVNPKEMFML